MKSISALVSSFHNDDSGAAFLEYTVLLGIILVVAIVLLTRVGNWANLTWSKLCSSLTTSGTTC